jgi:hypothetical protein
MKTEKGFEERVRDCADEAMEKLARDGGLDSLIFIHGVDGMVVLDPVRDGMTDTEEIAGYARNCVRYSEASDYIIASRAESETESNLIIVHGFHRDGRVLLFWIPFREGDNGIEFGEIYESADPSEAPDLPTSRLFQ